MLVRTSILIAAPETGAQAASGVIMAVALDALFNKVELFLCQRRGFDSAISS